MGTGDQEGPMANRVQHVVLLRFPKELTPEQERFMRDQVGSWSKEIGGFTKLRLGRDATGKRSRGYQYLLFTEFESEEALSAYFPHPVHKVFSTWVSEHECEVLAFDYALDAVTVLMGD
jgi:heme-degrading monooxygenase HmoA